MTNLKSLYDAVVSGDAKTAKSVTEKALAEGMDPLTLVQEYMVPAMDEVGRRFECNEYFVPELLIAARAMKSSLELVRPLLVGGAPITQEYADEVGAAGYSPSAVGAVALARKLTGVH